VLASGAWCASVAVTLPSPAYHDPAPAALYRTFRTRPAGSAFTSRVNDSDACVDVSLQVTGIAGSGLIARSQFMIEKHNPEP
jgi:hypothetical protein